MLTINLKNYWLVSLVCLAATSPAMANEGGEAEGAFVIADAAVLPFVGKEAFHAHPTPRFQVEHRPLTPLTRLMPREFREARAEVNNGASPQYSTTPIPQRIESHAAGPRQGSPTRMQALGRRAAKHVNYGFTLAARGAVFSAKSEFIQALALFAESRDETMATRRHTLALEAGLTAIDEANDFVPDDAQLRPELDVSMITAGHHLLLLACTATVPDTMM